MGRARRECCKRRLHELGRAGDLDDFVPLALDPRVAAGFAAIRRNQARARWRSSRFTAREELHERPDDAAGLPIFPGLVRYDEVKAGKINHALRFTVSKSQAANMSPARHFASSSKNANLPPMGARFRFKASYSCAKYSKEVQVICAALKKYGLIVADNGSNWYISGIHDSRWNDDHLGDLKRIPGSAFEAVDTGAITTK